MALHPRIPTRALSSSLTTHPATALVAFSLVTLLALAGCASTGPTSSERPASATATPTQPAPTTTPEPTTCAQLPGFASASALTLPAMEFPAGAVAAPPTTSGGGTGKFSVITYRICVPNSTADLMVTTGKGAKPFLALLPFYGWGPLGVFPGDGQIQSDCGSAKCFSMADTQRYLAVDQVSALSHGLVTFRLRHATPPPAPACSASDFPDTTYQLTSDQGNGVLIPLPPLSRVGMGQGAAGSTYIPLCSAGTPATITAFFQQAAPAYGWHPGAYGAGSWQQVNSGHTYSFSVTSVTAATNWTLRIFRVQ